MRTTSWMILWLLPMGLAYGQDSLDYKKRQRMVIIGSATTYGASMVGLHALWYSQFDRQSFRFFDDAAEWKQMDKIGHFYSAYQVTAISASTWRWAGMEQRKAARLSSLISFGILSSIEVLDGFSSGYGASASDWVANATGAGLYWGQSALWNEQRIYPKMSFHRTSLAPQRPSLLGNGWIEEFVKDYNGQTQWLSIDMDKFVPGWPKWINISPGYGAHNMLYAEDQSNLENGLKPYRQFYIGIDFDLTSLKGRNKFVNTLIFIGNMVRLPAPTLEFSQGKARGHWIYF